jgi:crotonobetainyl-CoA:carnitine CoA-transferase CaiB-like acyl-CoA transferase
MMAEGPLSGIKVVEWAHVHFGPGAGMFMSDMGADVIHVESREGDMMRHYATLWRNNFFLNGRTRNTFTEDLLRNKKSLTVDLTKDEAKEIIYRLIDDADVFLTNFRPKAATKLGLDYETLSARNPRLVYAQGTSYGLRGPDKDSPGLEMMGQARGALMLGSTVPGEEPVYPTMGLNDRLGAIGLLVAILSALVVRERTGEGQFVETSLLGWTVNLQASAITCAVNTGQAVRPPARRDMDDANYTVYQLSDGTWIALGMTIHPTRYWPLICEAIGRPELVADPRFESVERRLENSRALIDIYDEAFAEMTWEQWNEKIQKYQLISCRLNDLREVHEDEQILANEYLVKLPHPDLGEWWYVPTPVYYEKTPIKIRSEAPHLGQHTDEILSSVGYSQEEIQDLRERAVV